MAEFQKCTCTCNRGPQLHESLVSNLYNLTTPVSNITVTTSLVPNIGPGNEAMPQHTVSHSVHKPGGVLGLTYMYLLPVHTHTF